MSDISNKYVEFEEMNYDWLVEKFIKRYEEKWIDLVDEEYQKQEPNFEEDR